MIIPSAFIPKVPNDHSCFGIFLLQKQVIKYLGHSSLESHRHLLTSHTCQRWKGRRSQRQWVQLVSSTLQCGSVHVDPEENQVKKGNKSRRKAEQFYGWDCLSGNAYWPLIVHQAPCQMPGMRTKKDKHLSYSAVHSAGKVHCILRALAGLSPKSLAAVRIWYCGNTKKGPELRWESSGSTQ